MRSKNDILKLTVVDIKRVKFFIPECMEHALVSYGSTLGMDFIKPFCSCWQFEINCSKQTNIKLGECIAEKSDLFDEYEEYSDVFIDFIDIDNIGSLVDIIEKNIEKGMPTLFHLDTYYSEWGFLYCIEHSNHIAIAIGVDRKENKICIVDPDFSNESFWVEYSLLEKASTFYVDIKVKNINKFTYENLLEIICLKERDYERQFKEIEEFAVLFNKHFNPDIEFGVANEIDKVLDSNLIKRIREIIKGRNLFIVFLEQVASKYDYINNVIEYMYMSIGKWNTIMNLMFKSARTSWDDDFNKRIYNILLSIAAIEKDAYRIILDGRRCGRTDHLKKTKQAIDLNYINIDIKSKCNNKGFNYDDNKKCDLTSAGEYIQLFEKTEYIVYDNVQFATYFENELDNVVCQGQMIDINKIEYIYSVEILVCAEWGACEDSIEFYFEDGEYAIKKIVANDISDIMEENIIIIGLSKTIEGKIVNDKVGITYNKINFDTIRKIKSIRLPINTNMHIISIVVLGKEYDNS